MKDGNVLEVLLSSIPVSGVTITAICMSVSQLTSNTLRTLGDLTSGSKDGIAFEKAFAVYHEHLAFLDECMVKYKQERVLVDWLRNDKRTFKRDVLVFLNRRKAQYPVTKGWFSWASTNMTYQKHIDKLIDQVQSIEV